MADTFDPDAYLAQEEENIAEAGFDPDAYLAQEEPTPKAGMESASENLYAQAGAIGPQSKAEEPGILESAGRGYAQGTTLGFGDEVSAAIGALFPTETDEAMDRGFLDRYKLQRDDIRKENLEARKANPFTYGAGEVAGGVATSFLPAAGVTKGVKGLKTVGQLGTQSAKAAAKVGAAYGGAAGLGLSEADLTEPSLENVGKAALDTAVGAGLGGAAGAAGFKLGDKVSKWLQKRRINKVLQQGMDEAESAKAGDDLVRQFKELYPETAGDAKASGLTDPSDRATAEFMGLFDDFDAAAAYTSPTAKAAARSGAEKRFAASQISPAELSNNRIAAPKLGQKIGDALEKTKVNVNQGSGKAPKLESIVEAGDDLARIAGKGQLLKQDAGQKIGVVLSSHSKLLRQVDDKIMELADQLDIPWQDLRRQIAFDPKKVQGKVEQLLSSKYKSQPLAKRELEDYMKKFTETFKDEAIPDLWSVNSFKAELGEQAYRLGDQGQKTTYRALKDLERIIAEEVENTLRTTADPAMKRALVQSGLLDNPTKSAMRFLDPDLFQSAKRDYALGTLVEKYAMPAAGKDLRKPYISMGDVIAGWATGATTGNPLIGAGTTIGKATLRGRPAWGAGVFKGVADVAETASKATNQIGRIARGVPGVDTIENILQNTPGKLGRFAGMLRQGYEQRGKSSLAATHYLLSQKYPEYRDMVEELMKEEKE